MAEYVYRFPWVTGGVDVLNPAMPTWANIDGILEPGVEP